MRALNERDLEGFRRDGFVRVEAAVPRALADRCRERLWDELEEDRDDPRTWRQPVVRLVAPPDPVFVEAATSPRWLAAIHEVAGPDAAPHAGIGGTFAVRFPVAGDPGDDGWHVDGSYAGPDGAYWVNHRSRGRALLMLALFSDIGTADAPTRLRAGSHRLVADALRVYGDDGTPSLLLPIADAVHEVPLALATGPAGDVYLCHPFLVHAAQRHHGREPRFLAQPGVPWRAGVEGFAGV